MYSSLFLLFFCQEENWIYLSKVPWNNAHIPVQSFRALRSYYRNSNSSEVQSLRLNQDQSQKNPGVISNCGRWSYMVTVRLAEIISRVIKLQKIIYQGSWMSRREEWEWDKWDELLAKYKESNVIQKRICRTALEMLQLTLSWRRPLSYRNQSWTGQINGLVSIW